MAKAKTRNNKPGNKNPAVATRWAEALSLRITGTTIQEIADQLGYANHSGAYDAFMSALDATLREPAEKVRVLEVERLDRLMNGVWKRATDGDDFAIDRVLKIMDRRARLLGLDAPQRFELEEMKAYDTTTAPDLM
jgi:hypothetical protein